MLTHRGRPTHRADPRSSGGAPRSGAPAAVTGTCSAVTSRWSTTARAAASTSSASRATSPARSRSTSWWSAALFAVVFVALLVATVPEGPGHPAADRAHPDRWASDRSSTTRSRRRSGSRSTARSSNVWTPTNASTDTEPDHVRRLLLLDRAARQCLHHHVVVPDLRGESVEVDPQVVGQRLLPIGEEPGERLQRGRELRVVDELFGLAGLLDA